MMSRHADVAWLPVSYLKTLSSLLRIAHSTGPDAYTFVFSHAHSCVSKFYLQIKQLCMQQVGCSRCELHGSLFLSMKWEDL